MIGAIIGDIIGSHYEGSHRAEVDTKEFPLFLRNKSVFTDDTVLTCATAAVVNKFPPTLWPSDYTGVFARAYKGWGTKYPNRGYGKGFKGWLANPSMVVNNSFGNGAMMRCSPIALAAPSLERCLALAKESINYTHQSPESLRGVQSITSAIYMALQKESKQNIRAFVEEQFGHMCNLSVEEWRNVPKDSIRCNMTAPQALVCFLESTDYESAIRNAVYTRGDTDTIAAIAGAIAEAYYGVQTIRRDLVRAMKCRLPDEMLALINRFYAQIGQRYPQYQGLFYAKEQKSQKVDASGQKVATVS